MTRRTKQSSHPIVKHINPAARSLMVTIGIVALALSIITGVGISLETLFIARDVAQAQSTQNPTSNPGGIEIPTSTNNTNNTNTSNTTTNTTNNVNTNTNNGSSATRGSTGPNVTPPPAQEPTREIISVGGDRQTTTLAGGGTSSNTAISGTTTNNASSGGTTNSSGTSTGSTTSGSVVNANTQALAAVQTTQAATPRSGGVAFVSAGITILAAMVWYYYFRQYSGKKAALKSTERKIKKVD